MDNPALKHFYEAQTSYNNNQDYRKALQKTSDGFFEALRNNSLPDTAEILHQCIELANEILVVVWSQMLDDEHDNGFDEDYFLPVMRMCSLLDCSSRKSEFTTELTQMKELLCNLDPTWKEEYDIIKDMKDFCDENGRETKPKNCATVFKKLINLYVQNGLDLDSAYAVFCLINSIKIRDSKLDIRQEESCLKKWLSEFMPFKISDVNRIAKNSKAKLAKFRENVKTRMSDIPKITGKTKRDLLYGKEEEKSNLIRQIFKEVKKKYTEIIMDISNQCFRVLPVAPCKFYQIALMSKNSLTPFSSFQNVLVLPDGDAGMKYLDYFDIYNLMFRMVVSALSETPLHEVGIPFFIDANNTRWFFDEITDSGIHMVKNFAPINEVCAIGDFNEAFKNKKKFRSEMHFLEMVLIGGDAKLFSDTIIQMKSNFPSKISSEVFEKLDEKFYDFSCSNTHLERLEGSCGIDIETAACTVIPDCVCALGALHGIVEKSCFEIVTELCTQGYLTDEQVHNITYGLAIAYQISLQKLMQRPKVEILLSKSQVNIPSNESKFVSVFEIVGKHSSLEYLKILCNMQHCLKAIHDADIKALAKSTMRSKNFEHISKVYMHFRLYKEIISLMSVKNIEALEEQKKISWHLNMGMCQTVLMESSKAENNLLMAYALLTTSGVGIPMAYFKDMLHVLTYMGINTIQKRNFKELIEYFKQGKELCEMNLSFLATDADLLLHYFLILDLIASAEYSSGKYEIAFQSWNRLEIKVRKHNKQGMSLMHVGVIKKKAECLLRQNKVREAMNEYFRGLNAFNLMSDAFSVGAVKKRRYTHIVADILTGIAECQINLDQIDKAEAFCNQALHYASCIPHTDSCDVSLCRLVLAKCHLKKGRFKQAASMAFDAFNCAFIDTVFSMNRSNVLRESVQVVLDASLSQDMAETGTAEDSHTVLHSASAMLMMFSEREESRSLFKKEMSILLNVIQSIIFNIGGYRSVLHRCKIITESLGEKTEDFANNLIAFISEDHKLSHNFLKHHEHLLQILRCTSFAESLNFYGGAIVFIGYLNKVSQVMENCSVVDQFKKVLVREDENIQEVILASALKFCIYLITHYAKNRISKKNSISKLLRFCLQTSEMIKRDSLQKDKVELLTLVGEFYLKSKKFKKASVIFHDALKIDESRPCTNFRRSSSQRLRENIRQCVTQSGGVIDTDSNEASGDIDVSNTPPTMQEEIENLFQLCEKYFKDNDFTKTSENAAKLFQLGSNYLEDYKVCDVLSNTGNMVVQCALNTTASAMSKDEKLSDPTVHIVTQHTESVLQIVQANTHHSNLAQLVQPLAYALGHCCYAIDNYRKSCKLFKSALRALKYDEENQSLKSLVHVKVGKTMMKLNKYSKAQIHFEEFLLFSYSMKTNESRIGEVHSLLAVCFQEQNLLEKSCKHSQIAFHATNDARVRQRSCDVLIKSLNRLKLSKFMDID